MTRTVEYLFRWFTTVYGSKFTSLWIDVDHDEIKGVWSDAIARLSAVEIKAGMRRLIESGNPFPPTLPEFFAACRPQPVIPPVSDQRALDQLAARYGISTAGCDSYHALRVRIINRLQADDDASPRLTMEHRE